MTCFSSALKRLPYGRQLALAVLLLTAAAAFGQDVEVYEARLSSFPRVGGGRPTGGGTATATLSGSTLEVTGSFEQLAVQAGRGGGDPTNAPAATARLHSAPFTAMAGDSFFDLDVTGETDGTFSGSLELTPDQVEELRAEHIYVQIDSEAATGGHLWGWLLNEEED